MCAACLSQATGNAHPFVSRRVAPPAAMTLLAARCPGIVMCLCFRSARRLWELGRARSLHQNDIQPGSLPIKQHGSLGAPMQKVTRQMST